MYPPPPCLPHCHTVDLTEDPADTETTAGEDPTPSAAGAASEGGGFQYNSPYANSFASAIAANKRRRQTPAYKEAAAAAERAMEEPIFKNGRLIKPGQFGHPSRKRGRANPRPAQKPAAKPPPPVVSGATVVVRLPPALWGGAMPTAPVTAAGGHSWGPAAVAAVAAAGEGVQQRPAAAAAAGGGGERQRQTAAAAASGGGERQQPAATVAAGSGGEQQRQRRAAAVAAAAAVRGNSPAARAAEGGGVGGRKSRLKPEVPDLIPGDSLGSVLAFLRCASLQLGLGHSMQQEQMREHLAGLADKYRCVYVFSAGGGGGWLGV